MPVFVSARLWDYNGILDTICILADNAKDNVQLHLINAFLILPFSQIFHRSVPKFIDTIYTHEFLTAMKYQKLMHCWTESLLWLRCLEVYVLVSSYIVLIGAWMFFRSHVSACVVKLFSVTNTDE